VRFTAKQIVFIGQYATKRVHIAWHSLVYIAYSEKINYNNE